MSFIWPSMLFLLLLIPMLAGVYLYLQQRRRRALEKYGSLGFVQAGGRAPGKRRHIPPILFLSSLAILTLSLARPQATVNLPRVEGTVILVFDVSGSMAADDMKPTRMEAAKTAAQEFVRRQPSNVQIGNVAFSEGGLGVLATTNDREAILDAIKRLSPQRGTSLANGILSALDIIFQNEAGSAQGTAIPAPTPTPVPRGTYSSAVIVLLTDGENNMRPNPLEVAQAAADRGVRIYPIGVGSAAGVTLTVNGFTVFTKLDEGMLMQIAEATDGKYYNAESEEELRTIYKEIEPELTVKAEEMEITSMLAGVSLLVFLAGGALSLLWFSRIP